MKNALGIMIREAREARNMDREKLARKLKISHYYVAHLENGSPVYLSDSLFDRIRNTLGFRNGKMSQLARLQNMRARRYYSNYRRLHAA